MSAAASQASPSATAQPLDAAFLDHLVDTIVAAIPAGGASAAAGATIRNAARLALLALRPADAFQAMLAAQAVAAHYAIMDAFRRANDPELTPAMAARQRGNAATLSRTMQATLRTLRQLQAPAAPAEPRARPVPKPDAPVAPRQPQVPFPSARPGPGWRDMTLPERHAGSAGVGSAARDPRTDHGGETRTTIRQGVPASA